MNFSSTISVKQEHIMVDVTAPEALSTTRYAYYLCESTQGVVEKRGYSKDTVCLFQPPRAGKYYVKVFVRNYSKDAPNERVTTSKVTATVSFPAEKPPVRITYPTVTLNYEALDQVQFEPGKGTIYDILWDGVHFEFFVHYKPDAPGCIIMGTGLVDSQRPRPYFSRISWAEDLPATAIYYSDPTSYKKGCHLGWGYGTNDRWYLMDIATLLKKLLSKLGIPLGQVLFFGSSGGGFTSILLASMFKSRALAINPQIFVENYKEAPVRALKNSCLKPGESLLPERVDVLAAFRHLGYFPHIHILVNLRSENDRDAQLLPFMRLLPHSASVSPERLHIDCYTAEGGHNAMPSKTRCLQLIGNDLLRIR